jgi:hypothetical protein
MGTILRSLAAGMLAVSVGLSMTWAAGSIDKWIADLKNNDPEVRATAAYEMGCT